MKVKIPVITQRKEGKSLTIPPLVIIVLLLISSIIGVFYFHGDYNPVDVSNIYDENWFNENNHAKIPPDLSDLFNNLSDLLNNDLSQEYPELNNPDQILSGLLPNKTDFYVRGRTEPLVWKIAGLDSYIADQGWRYSGPNLESYTPQTPPIIDVTYNVVKRDVRVNSTNQLFILTLNAGPPEIYYSNLLTEDVISLAGGPVNVNYDQFRDLNSGSGAIEIRVNRPANVTLSYDVSGIFLSRDFVRAQSAYLGDARAYVSAHDNLARFTDIPEGYFSKYPEVLNFAENLRLDDTRTVYDQVARVAKFMASDFELTDEMAPSGVDPVDWFISNRGGAILYFLYTEALVLRYYGIPTRIAIGYIDGFYNSTIDMTEFIPAQHIFLWLEVFDPGLGFWVSYNVFPYLLVYLPPELRPRNLIDVSLAPIIQISAPREIEGYPGVYLNESFQILVYLPGISDTSRFDRLYVYDLNISSSIPIGDTPFTPVSGGIAALYTSTYEEIYSRFSLEPLYGVHVLVLQFGNQTYELRIVLMKRVTIGP